MLTRIPKSLLLLLGLCLTLGCGSPYKLHPVEGTVTFDGDPLANATVIFQPSGGGASASGVTDASGKYKLHDLRQDGTVGAEAGDYTVVISWAPPPAVDTSQMDSSSPDYDKISADASAVRNVRPPASKFPAAYSNPALSKLSASVKAEPNTHNFELSSKGPAK